MGEYKFNKKAFFAGVFFISALYLFGIYVSMKIESIGISEANALVPTVFLVAFATGHYIGKSLTKKDSALNSFFIGTFTTIFISIIMGVFLQMIVWILGAVMVLLTASFLCMHTSHLIEENEYVEKLVRVFAEILPGIGLPIVSFGFYLIPIIRSVFHI